MKKLTLLTALVMVSGAATASMVFTEDFNDWYDGKSVNFDSNWIGVNNNNGFQGDGAGKVDSLVNWRGGTYTGASVGPLAVGDSVIVKVDFKANMDARSNNFKQMFGLTSTSTNLVGDKYMAHTYGADMLGFDVQSAAYPGPAHGQSTSNGAMKVLGYFGAANADGIVRTSEDWGLAAEDGDFLGDEMRLTYTATKSATADTFIIDLNIENLSTLSSWSQTGISTVNATAYNATEMWFSTDNYATDTNDDFLSTSTLDNISVEVIPEPATLGLIAATGGAVLFIRRRFMI